MAPHAHAHSQHDRRRRFLLPLVLTAAYAAVEFVGGLWSGSLALLGDAGHMVSDAVALAVAAIAASLARRPPGRVHSYGWQRAEVIGALLNSVLMLAIVLMLVVEAVTRLLSPRGCGGRRHLDRAPRHGCQRNLHHPARARHARP